MKIQLLLALPILCALSPSARGALDGRANFEGRCSGCHGADGNGGEFGPAIIRRVATRDNAQLAALIRAGLPARGMPANPAPDAEMKQLIAFIRTLKRNTGIPPLRGTFETIDGKSLTGLVVNQSLADAQIRTDDNQLHLLRKSGDRYREVTSQVDWPTYNGDPGGNRLTHGSSQYTQINPSNLARLVPQWTFPLPGTANLEVTPVVVAGIMYVTSANECYALDAGNGRPIWHFQRPRTSGLIGDAAGGMNRGVAIAGERVFMVTDNAHLLALNRSDGQLLWEIEMADWHRNYNATSAPLIVNNLVISGTAGGEEGVRGFVAAYSQSDGKLVWRFWTVPKPGEAKSETWTGKGIEHGGAATWFTGTYDAASATLYWPTGNPGADYNGDERVGDNLYSDCILALDAATGKLKWHYQTTPHDLWDWDATETPIVADITWHGEPRKALLQANRNGFFYVWDRNTGELLLGKQFIRRLTWASGIGPDGRPIEIAGQEPSEKGTTVCPSQDGATNWFSPSFDPATGLFYVQTFEKCSVYTKRKLADWVAGRAYLGGAERGVRDGKSERILRAIDIQTGNVIWELPQPGPAVSWGGTLATATGLVFFGEESGAFMAADARTGKPLWSFQTNALWKASPMSYIFDTKQLIAIASGSTIMVFGLGG